MAYTRALTEALLRSYLTEAEAQSADKGASLVSAAMARIRGSVWTMELEAMPIRTFKAFRPRHRHDQLLITDAATRLRHLTSIKQSNRNKIVDEISCLLRDPTPFNLWRLDVKSFYESIPQDKVMRRLQEDLRLPRSVVQTAGAVLSGAAQAGFAGVPRGISLSASLAEDFMRPFDRQMRANVAIRYYARFVDDIIIVSRDGHSSNEILQFADTELRKLGPLTLNDKKTKPFHFPAYTKTTNSISPVSFEFLGYKFAAESRKDDERKVTISIAAAKIKRIKWRICKCLAAYLRTNNFNLLKNQFRFLSGNTRIFNIGTRAFYRTGIYYNYSRISDHSSLVQLDAFVRNLISRGRSRLSRCISVALSQSQKQDILSFSFVAGFRLKIMHRFSPVQLSSITKEWRHG